MSLIWKIVFLGLLSALCCANPCDVYKIHDLERKQKCRAFQDKLERSVFEESNNVYTLRETFFPTTRHPPGLLVVTYNMSVNGNVNRTFYEVGWSKSNIYTIVNPTQLIQIQLGSITKLQTNLGQAPVRITLHLSISARRVNSSFLKPMLKIITSRIKIYAIKHGNLTKGPSSSDTGYTWEANYKPDNSHFALLSLLLSICAVIWSLKNMHVLLKRLYENNQQKYSSRIETCMVSMTLMNISFVLDYSLTNPLLLMISLVMMVIGGVWGCWKAKTLPIVTFTFCCSSCIKCSSPLMQNILHTFIHANTYLFLSVTSLNIIPLFILGYAFPVEVSSLIFEYIARFYLLGIIISDLNTSKPGNNDHNNTTEDTHATRRGCCRSLSKKNLVALFFYCFDIAFFIICDTTARFIGNDIRLILATSYHDSSSLYQYLISFLPSIFLAGVGYFKKTVFENIKESVIQLTADSAKKDETTQTRDVLTTYEEDPTTCTTVQNDQKKLTHRSQSITRTIKTFTREPLKKTY